MPKKKSRKKAPRPKPLKRPGPEPGSLFSFEGRSFAESDFLFPSDKSSDALLGRVRLPFEKKLINFAVEFSFNPFSKSCSPEDIILISINSAKGPVSFPFSHLQQLKEKLADLLNNHLQK